MTETETTSAPDPTRGDGGLRDAFKAAARAIERSADPDDAYGRATELLRASDELVGEAALLRARMAHRIWQSEPMSLAALAKRIGTSKARADQLIRTAKESDAE